eukprot:365119-Chlamydomonas_euryale.AAC.1
MHPSFLPASSLRPPRLHPHVSSMPVRPSVLGVTRAPSAPTATGRLLRVSVGTTRPRPSASASTPAWKKFVPSAIASTAMKIPNTASMCLWAAATIAAVAGAHQSGEQWFRVGSGRFRVAQRGSELAQEGSEWLRNVQGGSERFRVGSGRFRVGSGRFRVAEERSELAQEGSEWLRKIQRGSGRFRVIKSGSERLREVQRGSAAT